MSRYDPFLDGICRYGVPIEGRVTIQSSTNTPNSTQELRAAMLRAHLAGMSSAELRAALETILLGDT